MEQVENKKNKKLVRSKANKILTGIIGGIAEYVNVDAVILRLVWVLVVAFTGFIPGVLVYVIAIFIVPEDNHKSDSGTPSSHE